MSFSVDKVDADKRFIDFRHRWLREGRPRESALFKEDSLYDTYHFAARSNGIILGIVSYLNKRNDGIQCNKLSYQLRGMAIDKNHRRQKIGQSILNTSLKFLESKSISLVWCNAREESCGFYKKQGFQSVGNYFLIPDVGQHILMYKYL